MRDLRCGAAIYENVRLTFNASFGINVVFVYVLSYKVYTPWFIISCIEIKSCIYGEVSTLYQNENHSINIFQSINKHTEENEP